jgi:putative membrane protein
MKPIHVFLKDTKLLMQKPMLLISFIAVAMLPMLYSGFLLVGSWDPYGKVNKLPVAIVNLDQGNKYGGKVMNAGSDFVAELKKNTDFKWDFVSPEVAQDGVNHNKYYVTVTIPADFSKKAATLMDDRPQQAEIIFEPNSDYNFVAGQIGSNSVKELRTKLSQKITEAYTHSMFDQIDQISQGFGKAEHGASQLTNGTKTLEQGVSTLKENLQKFTAGTSTLQNGVQPLIAGASSLHEGALSLSQGTTNLANGLNQLTSAQKLLSVGALQSKQGASQLKQGLQDSKEASTKLKDSLTSSTEASSQVSEGADQVASGLERLVKADPQLASNPQVKQLLAASQAVAKGSAKLTKAQQQLLAGSEQLDQGQQQLFQGADQLNNGQSKLVDGINQFGVKLNEAASGANKTAAGAAHINEGTSQIQNGLQQLNNGVNGLAAGSQKLDGGAGTLKEGMLKLVNGSTELSNQLNHAAAETSQVKSGNETVQMFANPVKITENTDRKLNHYGLGIAPYFLSLALFMGGLVFTTIFSVRDSSVIGASAMGRYISRTLTLVVMSLAQSIIASMILVYGIGLEVKSVPLFFLFTFITSLTFIFIIQSLVTWFDQPGRFIVIILMIFQLTSSAGTFPLEMLPGWMQKINPWLPMTHSIFGFKAIIATGDYGFMLEQIGYLAIYAVIFVTLTFVYFLRQQSKNRAAHEVIV